jgi:hypothetical protein
MNSLRDVLPAIIRVAGKPNQVDGRAQGVRKNARPSAGLFPAMTENDMEISY